VVIAERPVLVRGDWRKRPKCNLTTKAMRDHFGLDNCLTSCGQPEKSARIEARSISAAFLHAF
jgi:hypothetical protein